MAEKIDTKRMKFPDLYDAAEKASANNQRKFLVMRASEFIALVLAAFLGELSANSPWKIWPFLAIGLFLIALLVRVSGAGDIAEKRWYDARAAAESVESVSWQYAVGGEAFSISNKIANQHFSTFLIELLGILPNLNVPASPDTSASATLEMEELRTSSLSERVSRYRDERVKDQVVWYSKKALWNENQTKRWRWILIAVEASAVTLGILRIGGVFNMNWLAVFAATATGVAAWQQTKNYSLLSEAYAVTSHEVNLVDSTLQDQVKEGEWAQAVGIAEAAFSREHTVWLARRNGPTARTRESL